MGAEVAVGAIVVGALASMGTSIYQGKQAEKAAAAAAEKSAAAADTARAVSSSQNAATPTETKAAAKSAIDTSSQRRSSLSKTVNRVGVNGLRTTLG